ncbi:translocation protein [Hysterangium stoloniferum]|nr:translocation protein [Hysterangium stoloniferum]
MSEQQKGAPQDIRNVADFLRSGKGGLKTRVGLWNGKRVDYFKGKSAVKALLSPAYGKLKNVPPVKDETDAATLLNSMMPFAFFLLVQRGNPSAGAKSPKHLQVNPMQSFQQDAYFAWFYEGSQLVTYFGGAGMVIVILAACMFPLWPPTLRLGVYYLSLCMLGLLGLFFAIGIVRLIFYIITVIVASPGIWIFPKLFADVGFVESFIPLWEWDLPKKKSKKRSKDKDAGSSEKPSSKKSAAPAANIEGSNGAAVLPATTSGPRMRSAMIEEVEDDGS